MPHRAALTALPPSAIAARRFEAMADHVAPAAAAAFPTAAPPNGRTVVVLGGGGAGLGAAVEAYLAGARVVIVDKAAMLGGNT